MRRLDLSEVDGVRSRNLALAYAASAAGEGMATGLAISTGELAALAGAVVGTTTGAAAGPGGAGAGGGVGSAPGAGVVMAAVATDIAAIIALSSRAVGQVALTYGYDPEAPGESLFIRSVINAGTAMSFTAKQAAMRDVSKLTQALARNKTWKVLDQHILTKVYRQFAKKYGFRATKQGLGKFVPVAGIAVGAVFNWATLESVVDAAEYAYRRRFLLNKYPHLQDAESASTVVVVPDEGGYLPEDRDETISILDELRDAGGPDLNSDTYFDDDPDIVDAEIVEDGER